MAQRYFEKADLTRAVGGSKALVKLLDKDKDGIADAELVDGIIDDACAEMASLIEKNVSLAGLTAPWPRVLVSKSSHIGAFLAWGEGSEGQAIPEWIQSRYDAAYRWAKDAGAGDASMGIVNRPALDPPAKTLDPDPYGQGVSIAGFKRGGFR